jgi:hypothetical protein
MPKRRETLIPLTDLLQKAQYNTPLLYEKPMDKFNVVFVTQNPQYERQTQEPDGVNQFYQQLL